MDARSATQHVSNAPAVLWRDAGFRWLVAGSAVALLGDSFMVVALPWLALKLTRDPASVGAVLAMFGVPRAVLMLVGGAVTDRYSSRAVLILSRWVSAGVVGILVAAIIGRALGRDGLLLLAFAIGVCGAFAIPAAAAIVPLAVSPIQLQPANSALMMIRTTALLMGPLCAGLLIAALGEPPGGQASGITEDAIGLAVVLCLAALSYVLGAWMLKFVAVRMPSGAAVPPTAAGLARSVGAGLVQVWSDVALRALIFYYALIMLFVAGPSQVGFPVLVDFRLQQDADAYGGILAAFGAGSLLGMAVAGARPDWRIRSLGLTVLLLDACAGLVLLSLGYAASVSSALFLCFLMGCAGGFAQVAIVSWIQQRVPEVMLGRVMSILMFVFMGVPPVSAAAAGLFLKHYSVSALFLGAGASLAALASVSMISRTIRSIGRAAPSGACQDAARTKLASRELG